MDFDLTHLVCCAIIAFFVYKLLSRVRRIIYTHVLAKTFGDIKNLAGYGRWAVVTGSTDGIGKGYAKDLARRGMNIVLISRNSERLEATKKEIADEFKNIEVKTLMFDFGTADLAQYAEVKEILKDLDIGVLVNNVGTSSEYPEKLLAHPDAEKTYDRMLKVNCMSVMEMTMIVLPKLVEKKSGAVINIASASAYQPTPYLTVYSATKSFVSYFTRGLVEEYADSGVYIQSVYPFFVVSKMSKFKRPSFFIPDANRYARCALDTVGLETETAGCLSHSIQSLVYDFIPSSIYGMLSKKVLLDARRKYLNRVDKKRE